MRDSQHEGQGDRSGDGMSVLARTVVARIAARDLPAVRPLNGDLVLALAQALGSADPARFEALRPELRRARIGDTELADVYFPAVARHLGCGWAEDRISFAEVTLGAARMQGLLRQLGRDWASDAADLPDGGTVLMVLPEGEQHSLGAMVLTGQLRRQGVSVLLRIGPRPDDLRALVKDRPFDCAMVSVGCEEKLALCGKLVNSLKEGSGGRLWVAVGGAVLERATDIRQRTGADVVTNDPKLALQGARARFPVPVRNAG
jgi:methanogenic corrinoid protein MtbC1